MDEKNRFGEIVSKCWQDKAFKQRFLDHPKAVLKEFEIAVPEGLNVTIVENTDDMMHLVLPSKPSRDELSDDELDAVSGGTTKIGAGTISPTTTQTTSQTTRQTPKTDFGDRMKAGLETSSSTTEK